MNWGDLALGDWVRMVNILLCGYVSIRMAVNVARRWAELAADTRLYRIAFATFAFAGMVGALDLSLRKVPPGLATFITFFAAALGAVAVSLPRRYQQVPDPKEKHQ